MRTQLLQGPSSNFWQVCKIAGWIKMPLGREAELGPSHIVLAPQKAAQPPIFGSCLLWPNGRPSQVLLSSCCNVEGQSALVSPTPCPGWLVLPVIYAHALTLPLICHTASTTFTWLVSQRLNDRRDSTHSDCTPHVYVDKHKQFHHNTVITGQLPHFGTCRYHH